MENAEVISPKDDQIINKDDSITNKDGDNYLEKGEEPTREAKNEQEKVPTVTPDNDSGDPGPPDKKEDSETDRERMKHSL